ncbi:MAG TPA: hypothetical protein VF865_03260 [Acidobacteriaceae bacterium]
MTLAISPAPNFGAFVRVCYDHPQMNVQPTPSPGISRSVVQAMVLCILVAGTLDISDAFIFFGFRGTPPERLLQGIASGLLGPSALHRGMPVALLGLAIHYFITWVWATLFIVGSLRFPVLRKCPAVSGPLYGLLIYGIMNYIVLPHSRVGGHPAFKLPVFVNGVAALVFCMGLPIAVISKRVLPAD